VVGGAVRDPTVNVPDDVDVDVGFSGVQVTATGWSSLAQLDEEPLTRLTVYGEKPPAHVTVAVMVVIPGKYSAEEGLIDRVGTLRPGAMLTVMGAALVTTLGTNELSVTVAQ